MWNVADKTLKNRLILGTALYPSIEIMKQAIIAAEVDMVTVSLRRQKMNDRGNNYFWDCIKELGCQVLPNTAGCRTAKEAITTALMAREIFNTNWIKLEVIGDDHTLQPDPFELVIATKELISQGFEVLPYCTEDLILCQRLVEHGCNVLMPWGAPIGSGQGLCNPFALKTLRQRFPDLTLIIDAGIGTPSHAIAGIEMGYDGIILNSAVALADAPITMAKAFNLAIKAGRYAYEAGAIPARELAKPSTPLLDTPFWHQETTND